MGPPAVSLVSLAVVLSLIAALPGRTMVHAEGSSIPGEDTTTTNMTRVDNQCSPLQRRQDRLDTRMTERDTRLNGLDTRLSAQQNEVNNRLNEVNTRLNTRQNEVNSRLNRMDSRFDDLETALSDMREYLQKQMEAMGTKVEWALTGVNPHGQKDQLSRLLQPGANPGDFRPPRISRVHQGCQEALTHGWTTSGVYSISLDHDNTIDVYCDQRLDGGGWTVFQARKDGSVDFYKNWNEYRAGFGELMGEFWLGNRNIHLLTKHHDQQLRVELISPKGEVKYADYAHFWIEDETEKYKLNVSGYSGGRPPGDSLAYHSGRRFSTRDEDNDAHSSVHCATLHIGAWWYGGCHQSNLNGLYGGKHNIGMRWYHWKRSESMKGTRMMIRRRP